MSPSPAALEVAHLLDRLDRLARMGEQGARLNPAQWEALRYLARANRFSRTPAALAEYLASTRGTISRTLASLEGKGFVARCASPLDGRSVDLALTADGQRALRRDPMLAFAADIDAAAGGDVAGLLESLRHVLRNAVARNAGRAFGACFTCRHFRSQRQPGARAPHHCALLDQPLTEADSRAICVEMEEEDAARSRGTAAKPR
jgi:DNA-binding MarR family transcriptional regulator